METVLILGECLLAWCLISIIGMIAFSPFLIIAKRSDEANEEEIKGNDIYDSRIE